MLTTRSASSHIVPAFSVPTSIGSVVWATGHRRSYPWLSVPVLDETGEIRPRHGVTPRPACTCWGNCSSTSAAQPFIDGVGRDATFIADHLTSLVDAPTWPAPTLTR
jgi:putative flavoprotein involved in K+ transport